ncbi:MAG: SDR family NAD(P)-dependent oxidoreductase [Candidatus Methanomethylophilaceae archaeon]|nr:SDR family NAD(P)-dependent oxidoreductase [Candidatus Methanomethylophilaceae archaeon]
MSVSILADIIHGRINGVECPSVADVNLESMNYSISSAAVEVAIVTGAASGLGLHISRSLAHAGMKVIMADLDIVKCQMEATELCSDGLSVVASELDLADTVSIRTFVNWFLSEHDHLDLLLNNAGVMMPPFQRTAAGQEPHWAINHLGHFALTTELLGILESTPGSRVVTQSSIVHDTASIDFDDIEGRRRYCPWKAYKQSKLATLLFSLELQRRLSSMEISNPISVACHPGLVWTPLYRNSRAFGMMLRPFMHSIDLGIEPALLAAMGPQVSGGDFYGPKGWRGFKGPAGKVQPLGKGSDSELAAKVWELSKTMTGLDPDRAMYLISKKASD